MERERGGEKEGNKVPVMLVSHSLLSLSLSLSESNALLVVGLSQLFQVMVRPEYVIIMLCPHARTILSRSSPRRAAVQ